MESTAKGNRRQLVTEYLLIALGATILAINTTVFMRPAAIPLGSLTGISLSINHFIEIPIGTAQFIMNIPLYIIGYKILGPKFLPKTLLMTVILALGLDLFAFVGLPAFTGDRILASIFGGVLGGIGSGLVFANGGTGGGTDIISKAINEKTGISIGNCNNVLNSIIMVLGAFTYGSTRGGNVLESLLYALVFQFVVGNVIDMVINGMDSSSAVLIVTDKPEELSEAIGKEFGRGLTALSGKGMYSGDDRTTLLCAIRRHEMMQLKRTISAVDSEAFVIVANVKEVLGKGFKPHLGK